MFYAICAVYGLIAAGFFAAFIRGERRERRYRTHEISTGITRLEHYANTGETSL